MHCYCHNCRLCSVAVCTQLSLQAAIYNIQHSFQFVAGYLWVLEVGVRHDSPTPTTKAPAEETTVTAINANT